MVFIYGLVDPRDNQIKYVGKTVDLDRRYKAHIVDSKREHTKKGNWIKSLLNLGLLPELVTLEICNEDNWKERECFWIQFYGNQLKNGTLGGDSGPTQEAIDKISGENSYLSKLTKKDVIEARRLYRLGEHTIPQIAFLFNISSVAMHHAITGRTWKVVASPVSSYEVRKITHTLLSRRRTGNKNGRAILSEEDVRNIRREYTELPTTHRKLAEKYGISKTQIGRVLRNEQWV